MNNVTGRSVRPPAVLSFFLCVLMLLSLFSCDGEGGRLEQSGAAPEQPQKIPLTFTLPYRPAESLNPYTVTDRLNYDLLTLVHDGLVAVGQDFSVRPRLAFEFTAVGNTLVFTLKRDVRFHDGAPLTAADVEYSFAQAKKSDRFALTFEKVRAFWKNPDGTFTVELVKPYERAVALFTFPIVKNGSITKDSLPVGCGRYRLVREGGGYRLEANAQYYGGQMGLSTIKLVETLDTSTLYSALGSGLIHAVYTDMTKSGVGIKGNVELRDFPENKVVFLGLNSSKPYFYAAGVKKAISFAIDRGYIADTIMLGHAVAANQPFNPQWGEAVAAGTVETGRSAEEAEELLDRAGFKTNAIGNRSYNGKSLELVIIVNSENRLRVQMAETIAGYLGAVGLGTTVRAMKQDDYKKALTRREYDMYIGEVKLANDMDISPLLSPAVNFTGRKSAALEEAVQAFNIGEMGINELAQIFDNEMPILPLFYKKGTLIITRRVEGSHEPAQEDIFGGIETYVSH